MDAIRLALVGVGNCASALVQGLTYYGIDDVAVVCAFDVQPDKVGRDVAEAIWAPPNNARRFAERVDPLRVRVQGGGEAGAVEAALRQAGAEVVVSFLPAGSQAATEAYAGAALAAGCAFINGTPATLARDPAWARRFADAGLPLIGDDVKSQFGTTLIHRAILDALAGNDVPVESTFQINAAGNEDLRALQDPAARASKQATKTAGMHAGATASHVGVEYVPHLGDRKTAFIRVDARGFGDTPIEIDVRMAVEDSPSAAGVVLDAVRAAAGALRSGRGGVLAAQPARLMKAPPGDDAVRGVSAAETDAAGGPTVRPPA